MTIQQIDIAKEALSGWLKHPTELKSYPQKIEFAGEFQAYGLQYAIFKFIPSAGHDWLVGVSGGFEGNNIKCSGAVFSKYDKYDENTAEEICRQIVKEIDSYWRQRLNCFKT